MLLTYLLRIAAGLFCGLLLIYIYLVLRYILRQFYDERKERRKQYLRRFVAHYVKTGELLLQHGPRHTIDLRAVEELLIQYMHVLKSKKSSARLCELAQHTLTPYYRRRMRNGRLGIRYNTLLLIDKFQAQTLVGDVLRLLKQNGTTDLERLEAYRILASLDYEGMRDIILHARDWPDTMYREVLHRIPEQRFHQYVREMFIYPKRFQYNLLDVIGDKRYVMFLPLLEGLLQEEDPEIRIRSLKAISRIGLIQDRDVILPFLHSVLWQERTMAAKVMGAIGDEASIENLTRLLSDPSWWVRLTAAQALSKHEQGREALRQVAGSSADAFARDMAREWLERVIPHGRSSMD